MTILGTRPEIIRLSRIIPLLDRLSQHVLVHTGQNFEPRLNNIFFDDLRLRLPDHSLSCISGSAIDQIAAILTVCGKVILKENPDRLLILGDTNSALAAMAAKRMGIPVFHMEAGNRCYDDRVPEEVNRRIVDHCSDVLLPYTERSRANLLNEGIPGYRIFVTGNPILEVLEHYAEEVKASQILETLGLEPQEYFLVTLHRAENVDIPTRLSRFIEALHLINLEYEIPVICSLHPRTRSQLDKSKQLLAGRGVRVIEPLGLFDFVQMEKQACCVLSDSGTVQEECSIMGIPNVTLRDVTERPETVESGSSIITGSDPEAILQAVSAALRLGRDWDAPMEYTRKLVSPTIAKIILGALPG
ncbi:MAG TPA: UDP-N-acetylglucosamine 2-epimerase (non-hydrolyzing) [Syntrophomonadaceae bacterium]|nr:UDP-N-acetylglucosamine 2-epimerase (non-hydrolyzing) [Syntrophomonadaceae bacterium]